jgi:hypothetical protein
MGGGILRVTSQLSTYPLHFEPVGLVNCGRHIRDNAFMRSFLHVAKHADFFKIALLGRINASNFKNSSTPTIRWSRTIDNAARCSSVNAFRYEST